jgi:DNA-binding transcriptional MocR family regulator
MTTIWQPDLTQFEGPKYLALSHALRDAVRKGDLPEGTRLPPVRELAWQLAITPGTVARAYQIVTQEGLLEATVGRGTFVAARAPRLGPSQPLLQELEADGGSELASRIVDLRSPQLPYVGQGEVFASILTQIAGRVGKDLLEYPSLRRDLPLRLEYARWIGDQAIGMFGPEDIALTMGGQNAVNIAFQCCLRGDRPVVFCEELAYPGFRRAARLNRADVVAIALDEEGMVPEALDAACRRTGGRIVCITPDAQNPTAAHMSLKRRQAIVAVARAHDLQIIEDNCYNVPYCSEPSLRALAPERTWHVTSLSKSISAGLRFGAIVCPAGLGEAARLATQHSYFGLPRPVTDIVLTLLRSGEAARIRDRVQAVFSRRLELTLNMLGSHNMRWQKGLSFVWVPMPRGWRASTFAREAEAAGVLVRSADEYALTDGRAPNAVRIALAGGIPEADFAAAIQTLSRLLDSPPVDIAI